MYKNRSFLKILIMAFGIFFFITQSFFICVAEKDITGGSSTIDDVTEGGVAEDDVTEWSGTQGGVAENDATEGGIVTSDGEFIPYSDINTTRSSEQPTDIELEKRIYALESSKQDLTIWMTIFVTIVVIVIGLNVGLSVWQVGSIASREVEKSIVDFDLKFEQYLGDSEGKLVEQINQFKNRIDELVVKVENLQPELQSKIKNANKLNDDIKLDLKELLKNYENECEALKGKTLAELEKWHQSKILSINKGSEKT